jgi:hypothetical protein
MPEQSFAQSIAISGSGFDQKLQGLMSVGQAIAQGQMMKTQMAQQLDQQKQLIDYRTDAQVRGQMEIQAAQQPERQRQAFLEAYKDAEDQVKSLVDDYSKRYIDVTTNGLGNARFFVDVNQATGMPEAKIYMPHLDQEVDYQTYIETMDSNLGMAKLYQDLRDGVTQGWFPQTSDSVTGEIVEGQRVQATDEIARGVLSNIESTTDPITRRAYLEDWVERYQYPSKLGVVTDEATLPTPSRDTTAVHAARIVNMMSPDGRVTVRHVPEKKGLFGRKTSDESVRTIDVKNLDVQGIYSEVETISEELYGFNIKDIGSDGPEVMQAVLAGEAGAVPRGKFRDLAKKMEDLKDDEIAKENFLKLYSFYYELQGIENNWREYYGTQAVGFEGTPRTDQMMFNPNAQNPVQRFLPIGDATNRIFDTRIQLSQ